MLNKWICRILPVACLMMTGVSISGCDEENSGDTPEAEGTTNNVAYCDATKDWNNTYGVLEAELIDLVNQQRSRGASCGSQGTFGASSPLTPHAALTCAARVHSKDMADRNFFDHTNPDGQNHSDRIHAAGLDAGYTGENIAAGNATAKATFDQWMASDGHCANFMNPDFTHIGVGYYPGGQYGHIWTATLAAINE